MSRSIVDININKTSVSESQVSNPRGGDATINKPAKLNESRCRLYTYYIYTLN